MTFITVIASNRQSIGKMCWVFPQWSQIISFSKLSKSNTERRVSVTTQFKPLNCQKVHGSITTVTVWCQDLALACYECLAPLGQAVVGLINHLHVYCEKEAKVLSEILLLLTRAFRYMSGKNILSSSICTWLWPDSYTCVNCSSCF